MPTNIHNRKLTWADLVAEEPALVLLEQQVRAVKARGPHFCANEVWFGYNGHEGIKPALVRLVGWGVCNPELRTSAAYDLAYDYLYDLLPNCRDCYCAR